MPKIISLIRNGKRLDIVAEKFIKLLEEQKKHFAKGGAGSGRYPKGTGGHATDEKGLKEELNQLHLDLNEARRRGDVGSANDIQERIDGLEVSDPSGIESLSQSKFGKPYDKLNQDEQETVLGESYRRSKK